VGGDIQALRKDPSGLAGLSIKKIVDYYAGVIRGLPSPPIIMGHSFGGLFTQLLLDRGLGRAGVAIDSAPPKGIWFLPPSALRSAFPALDNPLNYGKAKGLTPKQFRYAFGNLLSEEESNKVFETYAIPGPDRLLFQAALANVNPRSEAKVNFKNNGRPPLLLIAGGKDHVVPASLTKTNFKLYHKSKAITAYKEFPDPLDMRTGRLGERRGLRAGLGAEPEGDPGLAGRGGDELRPGGIGLFWLLMIVPSPLSARVEDISA
jgi:pimeloyl-ACP methyl ester carboxylesterase